jgi:putative transposase
MGRRAEKRGKVQVLRAGRGTDTQDLMPLLRQMILPMVAGMAQTKRSMQNLVVELGLASMQALFEAHAEALAGPKHRHQEGRTMNHWGSTETEFPFAGRKVSVRRPRVRSRDGEVSIPFVRELQDTDPLPEYVVEQILLGVSTRGYGQSLDPSPEVLKAHGASKSAASRNLIVETTRRMADFTSRKLSDIDLAALMLDGIIVAKRAVIVALGIDVHGKKHALGLWVGSTENKTVCISLLQDLLGRGLRIEGKLLCVIDGSKGLRAALDDVFGDVALVQRCQNHKRRNVCEHLPEGRRAYANRMLSQAYKARSYETAKKTLKALVSWLENNGEPDAAASLKEGLEETLTVLKLQLPTTLTRSLATTNAIENLMGSIRTVTRNVKRWQHKDAMIKRWVTLGVCHAAGRFRAINGKQGMPALVAVLRKSTQQLDSKANAA